MLDCFRFANIQIIFYSRKPFAIINIRFPHKPPCLLDNIVIKFIRGIVLRGTEE